ncbi:MAG: glutaminase A [Devosia sp.]|nr:glutaminase A [Devosia sp.]
MHASALPVRDYLDELHRRHKENRQGAVASYIPELTKVDHDLFGIALATMDGYVYDTGDSAALFTIQSVSKAIIYGMALEDQGREIVLRRIGVEPSGEAFNSIVFDERNNRPFNPMVNAGAIAATALIKGSSREERYERMLDCFRRFMGRDLVLDEAVYRSESLTGHRNRAIAFLELNSGMIEGDIEGHLDLYFRQCSLLVNTVDLAIMAGTLANGGINPISGERAIAAEHVRSVLSVMNTCGMYDYAGGWQFEVGLPAKSGVGGGICAVLPGHLGIGVFSPRLDKVGNSERGVRVCEDVSRNFQLHLFEDRGSRQEPIRRFYRATDVRSSRVRRQAEVDALDHDGYAIAVCELQGELSFVEAERVTRRISEQLSSVRYLVLDMTRLRRVDPVAAELLRQMSDSVGAAGIACAVAVADGRLQQRIGGAGFTTLDAALEHFEDRLLAEVLPPEAIGRDGVPLAAFALLADWPEASLEALRQRLVPRAFAPGERLIEAGSAARSLYLLESGRVDVSVAAGDGKQRRVSTIDAGNVFGELALFGEARRTAHVTGASRGRVFELTADGIAGLLAEAPAVHAALSLAVGKSLAERLSRANREIQALLR